MLKYKIVGGPMKIDVKKNNTSGAFSVFEEILNREAQQGWIYHSMEEIVIVEKKALSDLPVFGDGGEGKRWYMFIFCKEV